MLRGEILQPRKVKKKTVRDKRLLQLKIFKATGMIDRYHLPYGSRGQFVYTLRSKSYKEILGKALLSN